MLKNLLLVLHCCLATQILASAGWGQSIQLAPAMEYGERVKVAKLILSSVYRKEDLTKPEARDTEYRVLLDPVATADEIIKNPGNRDGVLWDHNAICFLARNPNLISDDQILQLLEAQEAEFAFLLYFNNLLKNTSEERAELKERLRKLYLSKTFVYPFNGLLGITSRLQAAKNLGWIEKAEELEKELHQYFSSGQAKKDYQSIRESPDQHGSADYQRLAFFSHAPAEFRDDYSKFTASHVAIRAFLQCKELSDEQKIEKLEQSLKTNVGTFSHEYLQVASVLDSVARLDLPLAEKWIAKLPDEGAQCWARICIGSGNCRANPEMAKQQIRRAYEDLNLLGQNGSDDGERAYNYPLPLIGAIGLRAVEKADPDYLPTAIKVVADMAPAMLTTPLADARANYFEVAAAIARYDRDQALELFDQASDEVDLHSAASYFVALAAIDPARIADEYQQIPLEPDSRGITYRPYIRNAIVKALLAKDDDTFWDELANYSHLTLATQSED